MFYSDHGGGFNGGLGLILSPDKYNVIYIVPFIFPLHPALLVVLTITNQLIATAIQVNHIKLIQTF